MAITDIQISEELETNAPSIKYRGDEGPKSPEEEMMMADSLLKEEYEKYVYDLLEQRPEATPMSLDEFRRMVIGDMSGGQPLPQDPTKPVNPFQPKPTGPTLPNRQMAAYGGIMGIDGRRQYGIGSSFKKLVRKVIPNEVAKVAEVAAPFVAPFNPLAAGLMKGIGGFDRTGSIGDSLKSGLLTYGGGQLARGIGGGMENLQGMSFKVPGGGEGLGAYFSNPIQDTGGLGKVFGNMKSSPGIEAKNLNDYEQATKFVDTGGEAFEFIRDKTIPGLDKGPGKILETIKKYALDPKVLTGLAAGTLGATALMGNMEPEELQDLQRGEGLDVEGIRAEVIEAFKDPSGEKLAALRSKYPFLGTRDSKNIDAMGKAMGGRIGFDSGGGFSQNDLLLLKKFKFNPKEVSGYRDGGKELLKSLRTSYIPKAEGGIMDLGGMEKDYRNTGGFVDIGEYEKKDDVPARLSVNEFVMTADAVRGMGDGDIDLGAKRMENLMGAMENKKGAQQMFDVSERLSEVV